MEKKTQSYLLFFKSEEFPCWDPIYRTFPLDQEIKYYVRDTRSLKTYGKVFYPPVTLNDFIRRKNFYLNGLFHFEYFTLKNLHHSHSLYSRLDPIQWKDAFYFI